MSDDVCPEPVTRYRMCNGPAGHPGEHGNPWYEPEVYQGYGEDHADYLGENPFADTIEEGLL